MTTNRKKTHRPTASAQPNGPSRAMRIALDAVGAMGLSHAKNGQGPVPCLSCMEHGDFTCSHPEKR